MSLLHCLKSVTLKYSLNMAANAWDSVTPPTITEGWSKVIPLAVKHEPPAEYVNSIDNCPSSVHGDRELQPTLTPLEAIEHFDKCLARLESQKGINPIQLELLRQLRNTAVSKQYTSLITNIRETSYRGNKKQFVLGWPKVSGHCMILIIFYTNPRLHPPWQVFLTEFSIPILNYALRPTYKPTYSIHV